MKFDSFIIVVGFLIAVGPVVGQNWEAIAFATICNQQCSSTDSGMCSGSNVAGNTCNCDTQKSAVTWSKNPVYGTTYGSAATTSERIFCNTTIPCKVTDSFVNARCESKLVCRPNHANQGCSEYTVGDSVDKYVTSC